MEISVTEFSGTGNAGLTTAGGGDRQRPPKRFQRYFQSLQLSGL
jgi:hypothetical protein